MTTREIYIPKGFSALSLERCEILKEYPSAKFTYYLISATDEEYAAIVDEILSQIKRPVMYYDMDGVLAMFDKTARMSDMLNPKTHYFYHVEEMANSVEAIKLMISNDNKYQIGICSKVLGLDQAIDKEKWLLKRGIDCLLMFIPYGEEKPIRSCDYLLDDYSANLHEIKGTGIKLYNGINGNNGSWHGYSVHYQMAGHIMATMLDSIVKLTA